jgi:DNA-binding transcriptional MerR regulator
MATIIHLPLLDERSSTADDGEHDVLVQVGELARQTGKTVRALHLYEELGLLQPHARSKGKFRLYGPEALTRVRWIGKLQEMGLTLAEITELARDWGASGSASMAMGRVRHVFEDRLAQTREQLAKLRALESELEASIHYLDVCDTCAPTRVQSHCVACDLHDCHAPAPELVRGVQVSARPLDEPREDR